MQITLEAVEKVMELTGVDFPAAKEALVKADGDVDEAVKLITPEEKGDDKVKETVEKIKAQYQYSRTLPFPPLPYKYNPLVVLW